MTTQQVYFDYDFPGLSRVKIINNMLPLNVGKSESGKIEIKADLPVDERDAQVDYERYFDVTFKAPVATIELEEIPELESSFARKGRPEVTILLPKIELAVVESENLPLTFSGLDCALEVENENGPIMIDNCTGAKQIENENGPIVLSKCEGELKLSMENGPVSAEGLSGQSLKLESENGPTKIRSACFKEVALSSENGMIYYESLPIDESVMNLFSENGKIHLVLPEDFDFELEAETEQGSVKCRLDAEMRVEAGNYVIRQGEGKNKIRIRTENGTIKIGSDGYMNLNFIRQKLEELKDSILKSKTLEDKIKAQKIVATVVDALNKAADKITEARVKDSLISAADKLKELVEGFDVQEAKDKVVSGVEKVGDEVSNSLRELFMKLKFAKDHGYKFKNLNIKRKVEEAMDYSGPGVLKEFIKKTVDSTLAKAQNWGLSDREKQEVADRSRMKILEMLESGKISAEEAERLLKAIAKE